MTDTRSLICLGETSAVPDGQPLRVTANGLTLAVYKVEGAFYVTDDACTHGPGSLSEGFLEGEVIECNFHQGKFNVRTGEVVAPPCMIPIKTYKTVVDSGRLFIEL